MYIWLNKENPTGFLILQRNIQHWPPTFCFGNSTPGHDVNGCESIRVRNASDLWLEKWRVAYSWFVKFSAKTSKHCMHLVVGIVSFTIVFYPAHVEEAWSSDSSLIELHNFFSSGRPEPNEWHLTSARKDVPLISLFILENVPMLHSMAMSTYHTLAHDHPQAVIPTVLALYTTASLLTALAFILLGYFKMQHLCNALPKPVLMGCLAGMGIYLFACGLGTSTAVEWDWTSETLVEQTRHWPKLLLTLGLEAVLLQALAMAKRIDLEALVLPTFFLATWLWHKFWWRVSFTLGVGGGSGSHFDGHQIPSQLVQECSNSFLGPKGNGHSTVLQACAVYVYISYVYIYIHLNIYIYIYECTIIHRHFQT